MLRRFSYTVIIFVVCVLLVELVTRGFFAWRVGPNVLAYGTPFAAPAAPRPDPWKEVNEVRTVQMHENELGGYSKYQPREVRYDIDPDSGERFQVTINNSGFRGRDIVVAKRPDVTRVVTLGASSTFGYYSREDYTYPMQLEGILNNSTDRDFEVINLGVPHLTAAEIYALFLEEALPLEPDVVTFYEGNNDSARLWEFAGDESQPSALGSASDFLGGYLVSVALVNSILAEVQESPQKLEAELVEGAAKLSERFLESIAAIAAECERRGILFVIGNQQKRSDILGADRFDQEQYAGVTMQDELALIKERIAEGQPISRHEQNLFIHTILMRDLEKWAAANAIPFVDIISAMDQERNNILTHVHLSQRGNEIVARQLSKAILANLDKTAGAIN